MQQFLTYTGKELLLLVVVKSLTISFIPKPKADRIMMIAARP
jgi:hypothetical protein